MNGRSWLQIHPRVWITGLVALVHAVVLLWVLSVPIQRSVAPPADVLEIDFAELPPPQVSEPETEQVAEPDLLPEPEPLPVRERMAPPQNSPALAVAEPPAATPVPDSESSEPRVLTQLEAEPVAPVAPQASEPTLSNEAADRVDTQAVAAVLQRADCQRLSFKPSDDCPKPDPFAVAEASMVRQAAAPAAILRSDAFGPKSAVEGFFAKQDEDPFMFPGMDAALFTEGMAPGAYNAQRIRNGQDPLWDQEMIDGFRKAD